MEKRQRFTAEFKREAIRLMKTSTKPATALARELGVPCNRLYKWAQDAEKKGDQAFQGSGRPKASTDELSVLQRENACPRNRGQSGLFSERRSRDMSEIEMRPAWP